MTLALCRHDASILLARCFVQRWRVSFVDFRLKIARISAPVRVRSKRTAASCSARSNWSRNQEDTVARVSLGCRSAVARVSLDLFDDFERNFKLLKIEKKQRVLTNFGTLNSNIAFVQRWRVSFVDFRLQNARISAPVRVRSKRTAASCSARSNWSRNQEDTVARLSLAFCWHAASVLLARC